MEKKVAGLGCCFECKDKKLKPVIELSKKATSAGFLSSAQLGLKTYLCEKHFNQFLKQREKRFRGRLRYFHYIVGW